MEMSLLVDPVGERPWLDHTFGQALEWAACTYADAEAVVFEQPLIFVVTA